MTLRLALACLCVVTGCGRVGFDARAGDASTGDGTPQFSLDPPVATINTGSKIQLTPMNGVAPYTYDVMGDGAITMSGVYWSPSHVGQSRVIVSDAEGSTATADITYEGSTIFMVGGLLSSVTITTVYASTNGTTWNMVGTIPAPRANGALVVYDDRLLYIGGNDGGVPQTTIYASTNGADWSMVGTYPARIVSTASAVHYGALLVVSGYEGSFDHPSTWRSLDGVTFTPLTNIFPTPRHEADLITRGPTLVLLGGHGAVQYQDTLQSLDGGAAWSPGPATLNFATDFQGAGQLGQLVVRVCGVSCSVYEHSTDLATWTQGAMPDGPRDGPHVIALNGALYMFGGTQTSIYSTTDGTAWTLAGNMPAAITRSSAVVFTPR